MHFKLIISMAEDDRTQNIREAARDAGISVAEPPEAGGS